MRGRKSTPPAPMIEHKARLIVLLGTDAGRIYCIGDEAIIGRSSKAEVCLSSRQISRRHARVYRAEKRDEYLIEDLGSCNGTSVNGTSIKQAVIRFGDRISIGADTMLLFTYYEPLENQLVQLQKMQAMGQLAAGIAHDFNNLLGVISASLEYLVCLPQDGQAVHPEVAECLDDAMAASQRASELVKRLLDFAVPGRPEDAVIEVDELLQEVAQLTRRTFDRAIQIETKIEPQLTVKGNRTQLLQVLMNLCINARDAMPDGGKLSLSAALVQRDYLDAIPVQALVPHVVVTVEDSGIGMDQETCRRIFEPFFTTKTERREAGLGLSTAFSIVRSHAGHITVDSEPGKGSRFKVYLPCGEGHRFRESTAQAGDPAAVETVKPPAERVGVLLVDDESLVLRSTERLLRQAGFQVLSASNGAEAVEIYRRRRADIKAVLLDLNMPHMSGEETFQALREIDEKVKVILFSGFWDELRIKRALEKGASGFIRKPADVTTFKQALSRVIAVC